MVKKAMNHKDILIVSSIILGGVVVYSFSAKGSPLRAGKLTPELENMIRYKADYWNAEIALVKAICMVESNFNPKAKNPLDPSYGLMQITPILAQDFGLVYNWKSVTASEIRALMDVSNNLDVGCWRLNWLRSRYPFDVAVQMYNLGEYGYKQGSRNLSYLEKVRKYHAIYSV